MKNAPIQTRAAPKPISTRPIRSKSISRLSRKEKARNLPGAGGIEGKDRAGILEMCSIARPAVQKRLPIGKFLFRVSMVHLFRNLIVARDFSFGDCHFFPTGAQMSAYHPKLAYGLMIMALGATAGWAAFWGWALWRAVAWALA
jgi:hypothetical protein